MNAEEHVRAALVWTLGQVGRHSTPHARALAVGDVLRHLMALLCGVPGGEDDMLGSSEDLRDKARRALGGILGVCDHLPALLALLPSAPASVAKLVLRTLRGVLGGDGEARKMFLGCGGLKLVQNLDPRARAEVEAHGPVALRNHIAQNLGPGAFLPPASSGAMSSVAAGGGDEELGDAVSDINALYPADIVA